MTVLKKAFTENPRRPDGVLADFSVLNGLDLLRGRYRRMVIVSHPRHLADLAPGEDGLLVLSTDWLAWVTWRSRGGHAVHYEAFLEEWPSDAPAPETVFAVNSDWMYENDEDLTSFEGVSLGKLFTTHVGFVTRAYHRLAHALDAAMARFRPEFVEFRDANVEFSILQPATRRGMAARAAQRAGASFTDRFDPVPPEDPLFPELPYGTVESMARGPRAALRRAYTWIIEALFALRGLMDGGRKGVFLQLNTFTLNNLLETYATRKPGRGKPIVLAEQQSKGLSFLLKMWWAGIRLTRAPGFSLNSRERERIKTIAARLREKFAGGDSGVQAAIGEFVELNFLQSGALKHYARRTKSYSHMFRRAGVRRLVVADLGNDMCRLLAELARRDGIPCDEILNGMFLCPWRFDARHGSAHLPPVIRRLFAWGRQNEDWLAASGPTLPVARTGYPALDRLIHAPTPPKPGAKNVLILPLSTEASDVRNLRAHVPGYAAAFAKAFRDAGHAVRVKIHPGRQNPDYYREGFRLLGIAVDVVKDSRLHDHLKWADIVIGPFNSGAFIESVALGKTYYPVRPYPTFLDKRMLGVEPYETPEQVLAAIAADKVPDREAILEYFCGYDRRGTASHRVWDAIEADLADESGAGADKGI